MTPDTAAESDRLRRELQYVLETSLAQSDAEDAVDTLNALVRQTKADILREVADELDLLHVKALELATTAIRKKATRIVCMDPELCTVQDPCPRCG